MKQNSIHFILNCLEDKLCISIKQLGDNIMTLIQEFADKQNEYNAQMETHLTGLKGDIDQLNAKIMELQGSAGDLSAKDKEVLETLSLFSKGVVDRLRKMDELTVPTVPVE